MNGLKKAKEAVKNKLLKKELKQNSKKLDKTTLGKNSSLKNTKDAKKTKSLMKQVKKTQAKIAKAKIAKKQIKSATKSTGKISSKSSGKIQSLIQKLAARAVKKIALPRQQLARIIAMALARKTQGLPTSKTLQLKTGIK